LSTVRPLPWVLVAQDAITSAIAFVVLNPDEMTAAEIKHRLRILLQHMGYQPAQTS
jgi:hypothetical protein